jgi:hypothetical protein
MVDPFIARSGEDYSAAGSEVRPVLARGEPKQYRLTVLSEKVRNC